MILKSCRKNYILASIYTLFYFGNVSYWKDLLTENCLEFCINQRLPKKTYANRTIILTANGIQNLSIPLVGGRGSKINFQDIQISYQDNWVSKHKTALKSAYSKSPFYEFYMPYFEPILDSKCPSLFELNSRLFFEILRIFKNNLNVNWSNEPANSNFIPYAFNTELKSYPQVFRYKYQFHPDLSILDLLFCLGPAAKEYLLSED